MARQRRNSSQQLSLSLLYPDRYDVDNDTDTEQTQEYTKFGINLGTETPRTPGFILSRTNSRAPTPSGIRSPNALDETYLVTQVHPTATLPFGLAPPSGEEPRGRLWRSASFNEKHRRRNTLTAASSRGVDRDCGICCEYAVNPARTVCCGKLYCTEHIVDWLQHPSSDGKCPSCGALNQGILTLPSSSSSSTSAALKPPTSTPPPSLATSRPISRNEGLVPVSVPKRESSPESDSSSSSEDDSGSTAPSSPEQSWNKLEFHHSVATTTGMKTSTTHAPPIPMDKEVLGNVLCLVGLILAVWVLLK